jgi:hypothetical protein
MATKKSTWVLFGILVIAAWILGSVIHVEAETLNYKNYTYVTKQESAPVGDVDGHNMTFTARRGFVVFENGEVATFSAVVTGDTIKGSGSSLQYSTMTFSDGSTIIMKSQITQTGTGTGPGAATATSTREIIKGTGRFEGIKGTGSSTNKILPLEEGEAGQKTTGEGSIIYTLPSK